MAGQGPITLIEGVTPLETQFGAAAPKTVPDALLRPLLEPADIPTYAIIDAAKVTNLAEMLVGSGLPHRCLFKGAAYDEYKDVAPWLIQIKGDNDFTRNLFTASDAPWHLWDMVQGIYLRSDAQFDDIWAHFRKFTKVRDPKGKWYYFRFWEAPYLTGLLHNGDPTTIARLLSIGPLLTCDPSQKTATVFPAQILQKDLPQTAFALRDADIAALGDVSLHQFAARLSIWITQDYQDAPPRHEMDEIAYQGILRARSVLGLTDERSIADYVAASWLFGEPAETRYDMANAPNLGHVLSVVHEEARKNRYGHV